MKLSGLNLALSAADQSLQQPWQDHAFALDHEEDVLALFAAQVAAQPQAPACVGESVLSYAELDRRSSQVAHYLAQRGIGAADAVGLHFERSAGFLVALLGVWKAGACYVPIDPLYPPHYIGQILEDARPALVLGAALAGIETVSLDHPALLAQSVEAPATRLHPEQTAYIMYTSGSTGRPKGVMVPHRQILNWLHALWQRAPFGADEVVAQKTSSAFAISVKELLAGLLAGVPQLFIDDRTVRDLPALVRMLAQWRVTRLYTFPSQLAALLQQVADDPAQLRSLHTLFVSIEPCPAALLAQLQAMLPWSRAWYIYGCTEINDMTYSDPGQAAAGSGFVPIGRPIANTRVLVLDAQLQPAPVGVMGELYVASIGMAHGYWQQPGLTAERFIANPFSSNGGRLYRTGDMGRWLEDGTLEFLGRLDHEVKIRGYRVDLRQVEKVLGALPGIRENAVLGWAPNGAAPQLLAYVVAHDGTTPDTEALRRQLSEQLPTYMVPTLYCVLPALPRLPNGKLDAQALPDPAAAASDDEDQLPRTETEKTLARLWVEVLGQAGIHVARATLADNFFDLGGHSLLATQLLARIRQTLQLELSINTLFETPTLGAFAAQVEAALASGRHRQRSTLAAGARGTTLPLSYAQERLWFVHQHAPEQRTSYNVAFSFHLYGPGFSLQQLEQTVAALVARHETLRTTYHADAAGKPLMRIADALHIPVSLQEVSAEQVDAAIHRHAAHVFDLEHGPVLKIDALRVGPEHHVMLINLHHIACDGWSINVIFGDLQALHTAVMTQRAPALPALPVQYADYAAWQRRLDLSADLAYWRDKLAGYEDGLALPYDFPRPANRAWQAGTYKTSYPPALSRQLAELSKQHGCTLFMTLLASFAIVLHQATGRDDLCIGSTISGRDQVELENLIGMFVNILPFRLDLGGNPSVGELLGRVRQQVVDGFAHSALPFEHMLAALHKERDSSLIPLVPVMLRHQNFAEMRQVEQPQDMRVSEVTFGARTTPNEMDLQFTGNGEHLELTFEYAQELFSEATIHRLVQHHQRVLEKMVAGADCPLAALRTRHHLPTTSMGLDDDNDVLALFAAQVAAQPQAPACVGESVLSYAELDRRSSQVAHYLAQRGIGAADAVGLHFERSAGFLVALLGVWKAGACYVPIDPLYPPHYIGQILEDARPALVLGAALAGIETVSLDHPALLAQSAEAPATRLHPEQTAYIMYTSGSTGRPKGVMVPHRQILNWLHALWQRAPFGADEVVAQKTSSAFAISVKELLAGLLAGVPQLFIDDRTVRDLPALVRMLAQWRVTRLYTFPSQLAALLQQVADDPAQLRSLHTLFVSIEPCPAALLAQLQAMLPWSRAWYIYGCTEINDMTYSDPGQAAAGSGFVPIGRPIANTRVLVLDAQLQPAPVGVMGELYVASIGMAHGYWQQPGLTAERFIANPFSSNGGRLYRTGDMGRWLEDGTLEFLGRLDHEVKIRGYRVDLRQVEKVLGALPGIRENAVLGWAPNGAAPQLLAYVVAHDGTTPDTEALRRQLSEQLPTYMVPTLYCVLPALPRLPNGKLDAQALPDPAAAASDDEDQLPRTETEKTLARLCGEVLTQAGINVGEIKLSDKFFDLGGHSLLATQLFARIRQTLKLELSINTLFETPTLGAFAGVVEAALQRRAGQSAAAAPAVSVITLQPAAGQPVLFCLHPIGGQVHQYADLATCLAPEFEVVALKSDTALPYPDLAALAAHYCDLLQRRQAAGPYHLLGWSSGGLLAMAVAQELLRRDQDLAFVGLLDTRTIPAEIREQGQLSFFTAMNLLATLRRRPFSPAEVDQVRGALHAQGWQAADFDGARRPQAVMALAQALQLPLDADGLQQLQQPLEVTRYYLGLLAGFQPEPDRLPVISYLASEGAPLRAAPGGSQRQMPGNHYTMLLGAHAAGLAQAIVSDAGVVQPE